MISLEVTKRQVQTIEDLRCVLEGQDTISVPLRPVVPQGKILSVPMGEVFFSAGQYSADVCTRGCIGSNLVSLVMKLDADSTLYSFCSGREVLPGDVHVLSRGSEVDHRVTGRACHALVSLNADSLLQQCGADTPRLEKGLWGKRRWFRAPEAIRAAIVKSVRAIVRQLAQPNCSVTREAAYQLQWELVELFLQGVLFDESEDRKLHSRPSARIVRKVEAWVEGRAPEKVQIADLCRALQVPRRTLQRAFTETMGMGPAAYLTRKRLKAARVALRGSAPASTNVTDIATRYGFWELGRFAREYRWLFGERPSETLSRRRF